MPHKFILVVAFLLIGMDFFSQATNTRKWRRTENDTMQNASFLFSEGKYAMALPMFEVLYNAHPKEEYLRYCYGECALYRSDKHEQALKLLTEVYEKNKKVEDIEYDLARANHLNYKFDEALALIEKSLANKRTTPETKKKAEQLKKYCINAKELYAHPTGAAIKNAGNVINTSADEYVPVISADETVMIFTYRGPQSIGGLQNESLLPDPYGMYFEDVMQSAKDGDNWTKPMPVSTINTNSHDAAIAISADGLTLFVYRDSGDDHGDIYMSRLTGQEWSIPQKLRGQVNSYSWEGSCSMTADGRYLYFSSERGGGYGGKDIYRATLMPDSTWGNVINLGDSINTALDDDAPFIHPDGVTLFYSSKGKNSMGGYDIFQAKFNPVDSTYSKPVNMGYPVNTPDDDIYYVLSANGERGYYASGKSGGEGLKDIYTVYPGYVGKKPSVYMVKGKITLDHNPVAATIKVTVTNKDNLTFGEFHSNAATGNYLTTLPAGSDFKITYQYLAFPPKTLDVSTINTEGYNEKVFDVDFSALVDTAKPVVVNTPPKDSVVVAITTPKKEIKTEPKKAEPKKPVKLTVAVKPNTAIQQKTKEYAEKYGEITAEGLEFKVQIAAYKYPKNYTYSHLKGLGNVENLLLEDGITRITIGGAFPNLNAAYDHNMKVVAAGQKDAFVTVLYKGKRIYLEDLEAMGIFPKK